MITGTDAQDETASTTATEHDPVFRWRLTRLLRAGYGQQEAHDLAARGDVDLHRALELVEAGCPPETAYRILA